MQLRRRPLRASAASSFSAVARGLTLAALLLAPGRASAADVVPLEPFVGKKVRVDGALGEWPSGFVELQEKTSGAGAKGQVLLGYDDGALFVAARLKDKTIARTKSAGPSEDHLSVLLYFPNASGGAGKTRKIEVYPGDPGKLPALVKIDGREAPGASAVEAPEEGGLVLEAKIPWSALPEAQSLRVGLRGKVSYTDASAPGRVVGVGSTSRADGAKMPSFPLEGEAGLWQSVLQPRRLGASPTREAYGDVWGKGEIERVALYGNNVLTIVGHGYRGGKEFYFGELPVEGDKGVSRLELLDVSGDGKSEIILQKRIGRGDSYREVLEILRLDDEGAPVTVFAHEVTLVTREGRIENQVRVTGAGKSARVEIQQGKASGFEPDTFQEPTIGGSIEPALLPWQSVGSRVYGWKGATFALLEEKPWKPKVGSTKKTTQGAPPEVKAPPAPRPPTQEELLDRVYALYKKDRGVGAKKPRFDFVTDVVGDEQAERVLVHDRDVVVFGKGFKQGTSYTFITVGVKEDKDILSVTARDLTGDGKAEIVVHAVLRAKASEGLGGDEVQRQALFVYSIVGESLTRVFATETGRALGGKRVLGAVAFLPRAGGVTLELRPSRAIGWTSQSYPFPEDRSAAGGLEPLLLPWGSVGPRRYEFDGNTFVIR